MNRRSLSLGLYGALVSIVGTVAPAMASQAPQGTNTINLTSVNGAISDIIALCTGPVAKLIAVIAVIGGAIAFSQGREMNEGMKNLGIVAISIGLLIGAVSLIGAVGATI